MNVPSIDVYVSYRCDLRCVHCFLGRHLSTNITFSLEDLTSLVDTCPEWGTGEVTLLGGEPTLYPHIVSLTKYIQGKGMHARLVTNGQRGFTRFMEEFDGAKPPTVYFSVDGSCAEVHDKIRGRGTFARLVANVERSRKLGYRAFGITSVTRVNAHDILATLRLCDRLGLEHVNVHYVTNRGFAKAESLVPFSEWSRLRESIEEASGGMRVAVRADHSLAPYDEYTGYCSVRRQDNLMFYPDGRVFICAQFFDVPGAHSFEWRNGRLTPNPAVRTEGSICAESTAPVCPAISYVNTDLLREAAGLGCTIGCIYEKVDVRQGATTIDSACAAHPAPTGLAASAFPILGA
jgi:MoaA/NifB/PqqE/SkfB family radical SAM enzyme